MAVASDPGLLEAIRSLEQSVKRSLPFTIGAGILAIGAVIGGVLYVQSSEAKIRLLQDELARAERETVLARQELTRVNGILRQLNSSAALPQSAQPLIEKALDLAASADTRLVEAADSTAQSAQAVQAAVTGSGGGAMPKLETRQLTPISDTGWDIDIFWCVVPNDGAASAANEARALRDAMVLAEAARAGKAIAPGVTLGRIRVRPLSETTQKNPGYPRAGDGLQIRAEAGNGEPEAARAIRAALGASGAAYRPFTSSMATRWYISAFVCERGAQGAA